MSDYSFSSATLEQLKQAVRIKEQIAVLEAELASILSGSADGPSAPAPAAPSAPAASAAPIRIERRGGARVITEVARARMALAQKARWAKYHATTGTEAPAAAEKKAAVPVAKGGGMSTEGRERIAAAQRARWAQYYESKGIVPRRLLPKKYGLSPIGRARLVAAQKARWAKFHALKAKG